MTHKKSIICLVGFTGSGKSFVAERLARLFHCEVVNVGEVVKSFTDMPLELKNSDKLVGAIYKRVDQEFKRKNSVVVDGVREVFLLKKLQKKYKLWVIGVTANESTRLSRYVLREVNSDWEYGDHLLVNEFRKKSKEERLIGVEDCLKVADCIIENN